MLACVSLILYRPSSHLYSVFDPPSASTGLCLDQLNVGTRPVWWLSFALCSSFSSKSPLSNVNTLKCPRREQQIRNLHRPISEAFECFQLIRPTNEHGIQACAQDAATYLLSTILLAMCFTFGFNYSITAWRFGWGLRNSAISSTIIITAINTTGFVVVKWGKKMRKTQQAYYRKVIHL